MIKEIIVVEGKDDVAAVKRAVNAECIITGGFALSKETLKIIMTAQEKRGVIVFTDPDRAGELIRKRINKVVKGCKQAFLPQEEGLLEGDIGIENATPTSIINALKKARMQEIETTNIFSRKDMFDYNLEGLPGSAQRRAAVGRELGIGYTNGKQFLRRLNSYGITRGEFLEAITSCEEESKD